MKELKELYASITQGEWLYVKNDESISVCVRNDGSEEEATVFLEVSGRTPAETEANAKLILLAQSAIPGIINANEKLGAALSAALAVLSEAEVTVPESKREVWDTLVATLADLNVTAEALQEAADATAAHA